MTTAYVDSGAFIAVLRRKDADHRRAAKHLRELRESRTRMITSDAVVAETATRLRNDVGLDAALAFRRLLDAGGRNRIVVHDSDARVRADAFDIMAQYADLQPSFADCVGAVIAKRERVASVFALDNDFRVLGFDVQP